MRKRRSAQPRGYHVELKKARGKTPSSQRWLRRQLNDPFVRRAQQEGFRSRAAYKLLELDQKFSLFAPDSRVVDIGCAPGGWLQVVRAQCARKGKITGRLIGIDLLPTEPIEDVTLFQGDAREALMQKQLLEACSGVIDVVLSDMAAPMTGHAKTDHLNVAMLAETSWDIAEAVLKFGGHFLCKVYAGGAEAQLLERLKQHFRRVKHVKPAASRNESRELYLVALERRSQPTLG